MFFLDVQNEIIIIKQGESANNSRCHAIYKRSLRCLVYSILFIARELKSAAYTAIESFTDKVDECRQRIYDLTGEDKSDDILLNFGNCLREKLGEFGVVGVYSYKQIESAFVDAVNTAIKECDLYVSDYL